jgi:hypothetical protein
LKNIANVLRDQIKALRDISKVLADFVGAMKTNGPPTPMASVLAELFNGAGTHPKRPSKNSKPKLKIVEPNGASPDQPPDPSSPAA